jgi:hypothetical protein
MILAGMGVSSGRLTLGRIETHNIEGKQAFTAAPPRVMVGWHLLPPSLRRASVNRPAGLEWALLPLIPAAMDS